MSPQRLKNLNEAKFVGYGAFIGFNDRTVGLFGNLLVGLLAFTLWFAMSEIWDYAMILFFKEEK